MTEPYTLDELMCVLLAREIRDGDWVNHGAVVPLAGAALMLAKTTHAPNLEFFYLGTVFNSVNPGETDLSRMMVEPELAYRSSRALISHADILSLTARGGVDFQFLRPLQVDEHGSVNVSIVGDVTTPTHRFHGIAVADAMILVRRVSLYVTEHTRDVFPASLTFRTGSGHTDGDAWRAGLGAGAGPESVITPLCVFDFETPGKTARIRSIHPGVTEAEVLAATGFVPASNQPPESLPPTELELELLRSVVDPLGSRKLEFKSLRAETQERLRHAAA